LHFAGVLKTDARIKIDWLEAGRQITTESALPRDVNRTRKENASH
jgi:hypothetical protein